jgi:heat shock protein HslJ
MKKTLQTTISLGLILGSLSINADANPATELETRHWQLVQYLNESGATGIPLDARMIDIQLSAGKFSGTAGCNSYFGNYLLEGEKLIIVDAIGTTMKHCPGPVMEQEHAYLELLGQVHSYHIDDETLVLLNQVQQPVLEYGIQRPAELEKTQWQATGVNNGRGGVVSSASTTLTNAQFLDGKLTGKAGCNQYSAGYTLEDNKITIGPVMTTRMHCQEPKDIMRQEQEYLQAITGTRIYTLDTSTLELRNEEGALQARFSIEANAEGGREKDQQ